MRKGGSIEPPFLLPQEDGTVGQTARQSTLPTALHTKAVPRLSLFRIYRPVNWEFFRIYPPDFQGHQATLGATSAIIAALWN